jgi:NodT family efflux transporter outer membrane factor (OMF) lipoprotein
MTDDESPGRVRSRPFPAGLPRAWPKGCGFAMRMGHRVPARLLTFSLLLIVLAPGCTIYKSKVEDDVPIMPAGYERSLSIPAEPAARWWRAFGDERLNRLMQRAFEGNLDLAEADARWRRFRALYRVEDAARWPTLQGNFSPERARTQGPFGATINTSYEGTLNASFEVDLWSKLKASSQAALFDLYASEADLEALYISLSADVADTYFEILAQRAQIDLLDRTIKVFEDSLELVEVQYREGLVSALDVYQAQQNLADARARRPQFARQMAQSEHALSVLLGRYPEPGIAGEGAVLPATPPPLPPKLPAVLLINRPDLQSELMTLSAADARVGRAFADRFPSLDLRAVLGSSSERLGDIADVRNHFWRLASELVMPIIDAGRRRAEQDRREAQYEERLAAFRGAALEAVRDVENALVANEQTAERIRRLKELIVALEGVQEMALFQYIQGLADYLTVLTSQRDLLNAKSNLITAERQLLADRVALARALGGSWPREYARQRLDLEKGEEREPPPFRKPLDFLVLP